MAVRPTYPCYLFLNVLHGLRASEAKNAEISEGWDFSIEISLFVRIVIFIENFNLSYLSRGRFCV